MWKKTLGFALLVLFVSVMLQGCYSSRRAYYRDGFAPGYVNVRVRHGYRAFGPSYRVYRYRDHDGHHHRSHDRHHDRDHHDRDRGRRHRHH
jgi:hypothetical protein